jgi:phage shock protein C
VATMPRRERLLRRSRSGRILGGVCAGVAHYFDTDPLIIRLIFIGITLAMGSGVLLYVALWVLIPDGAESTPVGELIESGINEIREEVVHAAERMRKEAGRQ